ncbi:copper transporter [Janibacter sp. GXQ6167]|uniref:copper transporter n=1 Tax=Janibacter sp. GXQ6167 TaxID=3240791 RepID=UPI003523489E
MIDFRYHIVSLAAVLIALSIGIVLGAGPLNEGIGSTLTGEVSKLRAEKDAQRAEINELTREASGRDAYDEATLERVVSGRLRDRTVTVVTLPQADSTVTEELVGTLKLAGASVSDSIALTDAWVQQDEAAQTTRDRAGEEAASGEPVASGQQRIDVALGIALTGQASGGRQVDTAGRQRIWSILKDADLLDGPDDVPTATRLVVVTGGPVSADTADEATTLASAWVGTAAAIDARGAVVLTGTPRTVGGDTDVSVVTVARADATLSTGISTVDVPELPLGRAALVLALVEQSDGGSGHYGLGADATAPIPEG